VARLAEAPKYFVGRDLYESEALRVICADFAEAALSIKGHKARAAARALSSPSEDTISLIDSLPALAFVFHKHRKHGVLHVRVGGRDEPFAFHREADDGAGIVELVLRDRDAGPSHVAQKAAPDALFARVHAAHAQGAAGTRAPSSRRWRPLSSHPSAASAALSRSGYRSPNGWQPVASCTSSAPTAHTSALP
jgi:hypothetical protein